MFSKFVKLITDKIIINKMSMHNFLIFHRNNINNICTYNIHDSLDNPFVK